MTWINRLQDIPIEIITGDGEVYNPIFRVVSSSLVTNESVFEFINIPGALVRRGEVGLRTYSLNLHFVGENNIDTVQRFIRSTSDRRPWTLRHPYFDEVLVQPSTINDDYSLLNDVVITVDVYETISDIYPQEQIDVQTQVEISFESTKEIAAQNNVISSSSVVNDRIDLFTRLADNADDYQEVLTQGNNALNNVNEPIQYMRDTSDLLRSPARFYQSVVNKLNILEESFTDLLNAFTGAITLNERILFENVGANTIASMAEAVVFKANDIAEERDLPKLGEDYLTRSSVILTISRINNYFDQYQERLTELTNEDYLPSAELNRSVRETLRLATSQLFNIAQNSLQERTYTLITDMDLITLHHRLFGNINSESIRSFVDLNDLSFSELLIIEKEKTVNYLL